MDFGVADLEPGELVGEPVAVDVFQLEQRPYLASTTRAASGSSASRCSWKASVPSESVAARLSRLFRSTAASIVPSGLQTA